MVVDHLALRVFATRAARRIGATALVILAALRCIGQAIGGSKSSGTKKHGCSD
jgi:hypothetical protein